MAHGRTVLYSGRFSESPNAQPGAALTAGHQQYSLIEVETNRLSDIPVGIKGLDTVAEFGGFNACMERLQPL